MAASAPDHCPVCGAAVPGGARACPGCGADERTGWDDEKTRYDGLDLPESAFENDDDTGRAIPTRRARGAGAGGFWRIVGIVLLVLIVFLFVFGR